MRSATPPGHLTGSAAFWCAPIWHTSELLMLGKRPLRSAPFLHSTWFFLDATWMGSRPLRSVLPLQQLTLVLPSRLGRPVARNPQVIQIQSDLPISLVPRRLPWRIQSDLPNPSLWKRVGLTSKVSFGLLKSTGYLAVWVPPSLPHSWWRSPSPDPSLDLLVWLAY